MFFVNISYKNEITDLWNKPQTESVTIFFIHGPCSPLHSSFHKQTNDDTPLYGGYAPCGSALVITLLQKYRFPLSPSNTTPELTHTSLHTPTYSEPPAVVSTRHTPLVSDRRIIRKHTLSSFRLHSFALFLPFGSLPLLVALFLHSGG